MAVLEMQANRPYSYFSGYDPRNLNLNATCSSWPLNCVDNTTQNGRHYSGSMLPSSSSQHFVSKEIVKQIILQHEATFQEQIQHLHHLYKKQRELMDEMRNNSNKHHLRLEMLQSNPFLSENSANCTPEKSQISCLPWLNHAQKVSDVSVAKSSPSNASYFEKTVLVRSANAQTGSSVRDSELIESKLKKIGKKVLDLELPADEYIDSEEEEGESLAPAGPKYDLNMASEFSEETEVEPLLKKNDRGLDIKGVNTAQASYSQKANPLVDLNEPIVLDDEEEEEAEMVPVSVARDNEIFCSDTFEKISSQCKVTVEQMIQKIQVKEDPEDCPNILPHVSTENQEECTSDEHEAECGSELTETFFTSVKGSEVEQVPETIASHLVDQGSGKSLSYGENFDLESLGSNCSTNSYLERGAICKDTSSPPVPPADINDCESSHRKHKHDGVKTFTIIQALPCADSPMLLSCKFRKTGIAGDKSPWSKKLKCGSHACCGSNCSCVCTSDNDFLSELSGTKERLKDSKCDQQVCDTKDAKFVPNLDDISVQKSGRSSGLVTEKSVYKFLSSGSTVDLNSCINEKGCWGASSLSTEVDMRASGNPKDNGESDEKQIGRHMTLSNNGSERSLDELVRTAAEALVTVSSSHVQNCVETLHLKHCKTWKSDCLNWFAGVVGSAIDDPTSEFGVTLSCKHANSMDEQLSEGLDFFEEMTLNLEEIKEQDYCFKPNFQPEEVTYEASMVNQPRRGRTRRGRQQRKDFQKEVLPSLASLSRHEVTKDLQAIGGLIETTRTRRSSGLRRSSANEWTEVTKRRRGRPLSGDCRLSEPGHSEVDRIPVGWGNITRGRRGLRIPAIPTRFIFSQG